MKRNFTHFALLLTALAILWGCKETESEAVIPVAVPEVPTVVVGKWYQKRYDQSYFDKNGTVRSGGSYTVDFDDTDFIEFSADGTYKNKTIASKYTRTKDEITIPGMGPNNTSRDFYIKKLTYRPAAFLYFARLGKYPLRDIADL